MVELDHPFSTARPIDEAWQAILDLERLVPCVEGGSVIEKTGPETRFPSTRATCARSWARL
ncbi:MAG: hypothetical protein WBP81_23550 [Solirubrobacteraceae bacterium]